MGKTAHEASKFLPKAGKQHDENQKKLLKVRLDAVDAAIYEADSAELDAAMAQIPDMLERSKHNKEDRLRAIAVYTVYGRMRETAEVSGINYWTLMNWRREEWWQVAVDAIRKHGNDRADARYTQLHELALNSVEDRLLNGDTVLHQGEAHQVPMRGKDAAIVSSIFFDKRQILRSLPTSITAKSNESAMKELAEWFAEQSSQWKAKSIDATHTVVDSDDES